MLSSRLPRVVGRTRFAPLVFLLACGPQELTDPGSVVSLVQGVAATGLPCGTVLTSSITLTEDIVCPNGFTGTVFTLGADGITFDGAEHTIDAPDAQAIFSVEHKNWVTIRNVTVLPGRGTGKGLYLANVRDSTFSHIQVSGRTYGIYGARGVHANAFTDNSLSGNYNALYIHDGTGIAGGTTISRNNLSHSEYAVRWTPSFGPISGSRYLDPSRR